MSNAIPSRGRRAWLLFALLVSLLVYLQQSGRLEVPERWNPWAPLAIDEAPNLLTTFKLARASRDREACLEALAATPMRFVALDDRQTGPGCGFENAVRIERSHIGVGEAFSLSCRAALSLALWERHVLQAAARDHLGQDVVAMEHFGSYACRNVYGREQGRRSQHATADALDVAGLLLDDGRRIRVVRDWDRRTGASGDGQGQAASLAPEAQFLRAIHRGACTWFDSVLGPDYNRAHADHFHFDRGGFRACR